MLEFDLNSIIKKGSLKSFSVASTDRYYDHTTFKIESLSDYIQLVETLSFSFSKNPGGDLLYRGMADSQWWLLPSILRNSGKNRKTYALEHDLAVSFLSEMPDLFSNTNHNFEKLFKMQHFGIPTRLLDFTQNPLVALYFACAEHPSKQGRVVFTRSWLSHFDEPIVECISSLFLIPYLLNMPLDGWLEKSNLSVSDYLFKVYTDLHDTSPLFVKPIYLDRRMEAQKSVFLLFHNYIRDTADRKYYHYGGKGEKNLAHLSEDLEEIYKEQIQAPTLSFGSSPCFVVDKMSFERLADFYRAKSNWEEGESFSQKFDRAVASRFVLEDDIEPLELKDIWFNFASILIPAKKKRKLLMELQYIGIDEAYIYPDVEHIAKRVKKHFY